MHPSRRVPRLAAVVSSVTLVAALAAGPARANPPAPEPPGTGGAATDIVVGRGNPFAKDVDRPNAKEVLRLRARRALLDSGKVSEAAALATAGQDRVLVILVEFGGSDTFTWTNGVSTWDPLGDPDPGENTNLVGDCSRIAAKLGIGAGASRDFTYSGPLHNQIERPRSAADRSGESIWTPDFSPSWFDSFMFGNGVVFDYARQDGSRVKEDFTGKSVRQYYAEFSDGTYTIDGDVIGWVQVPHSSFWYDADQCPGARSGISTARGVIPGAGNARQLVRDALDAVDAVKDTIPGFAWANYDQDGDTILDRVWIVHAGYGEEDSTTLLRTWDDPATPENEKRTDYGEGAVWSHSSAVAPPYAIGASGYSVGPYIMMPENGGIGVFAHEYAHNLGASDLYAYGEGETSAGFWTLMADDWTGYPLGYQPPAIDPWHLDQWGWLNPYVVTDPASSHEVTLGQASAFPGGANVYRGVKIPLPDLWQPLPVAPIGGHYWWGGRKDVANGMMTLAAPVALAAGEPASLSFSLVYDIEDLWDFLWVQVSGDGGASWTTLTNANTTCTHVAEWIGGSYGFPDDLCAAGIGGFTSYNPEYPAYGTQTFDLSAWAGQSVLLRFWYMTDWGTLYSGAFVDDVAVTSGAATVFSDGAEAGPGKWVYAEPWVHSDGGESYRHAYYLQWRNTNPLGGYDAALGDNRWRFGPADSGLLVWYADERYADNEVFNHLSDFPGWGPKGMALVVDAHPEPWREPYLLDWGFDNEGGNVSSRMQMRDAPFGLDYTFPFVLFPEDGYVHETSFFPARPAVSVFDDALDWYPGAEYVSRGPGYVPASWKWVTTAWDASVVVPSSEFYGIKAPGYVGTGAGQQEFRFDCSPTDTGRLGCYWYGAAGLGYDGGDGKPGTVGGSYGFRVAVVDAAADGTWGTIRISRNAPPEARDQAIAMAQDTARAIALVSTDPEGKPLTWSVSTPAQGALTGTAPSLTYTPAPGFVGDDSFTFQTNDGHANSNLATVSIAVRPAQRQTFTSEGAKDGWVRESSEMSGAGGTLNATGTTILVGDDALDRQYRGVLSFNTAALPDGAVVLGAQLKVRYAGVDGQNPMLTHNPLQADVRAGRFGTSAGLQVSDFQAPASRLAAAAFRAAPTAGWYAARVGAKWLRFVSRTAATQFRLRFRRDDNDDLGGDALVLSSGNAPAASRPKLIVDYVVP